MTKITLITFCILTIFSIGNAQDFKSTSFRGELGDLTIQGTIEYKADCKLATPIVRATLKNIEVIDYNYGGQPLSAGYHPYSEYFNFPIKIDDGYLDIKADLRIYATGYTSSLDLKKAHLSLWNSGKGNAFMADQFRFESDDEKYITDRIAENCSDLISSFYSEGSLEDIKIIGGFLEINDVDVENYILNRIKEVKAKQEEEKRAKESANEKEDSFTVQEKKKAEESMKRHEAEQRIRDNQQNVSPGNTSAYASSSYTPAASELNTYDQQRKKKLYELQQQMQADRIRMQKLEAGTQRVLGNLSSFLNGFPRTSHNFSALQQAQSPAEAQIQFQKLRYQLEQENKQIEQNFNNVMNSINSQNPQTKEEAAANTVLAVGAAVGTIAETEKNKKRIKEAEEIRDKKFRQARSKLRELYRNNRDVYYQKFLVAVTVQEEEYYSSHYVFWNCCDEDLSKRFSYRNTYWTSPNCEEPQSYKPNSASPNANTYYQAARRKYNYIAEARAQNVREDLIDATKFLIDKALDSDARYAPALAFRAKLRADILLAYTEVLVAKKLDPDNKDVNTIYNEIEKKYMAALAASIENSDMPFINKTIKEGFHRGKQIKSNFTASQYAIALNKRDAFAAFESDYQKQGLNLTNEYIELAIKYDADHIVDYLFSERNVSTVKSATPLLEMAYWNESKKAFAVLIKHGLSVKQLDKLASNKITQYKLVVFLLDVATEQSNPKFIQLADRYDLFDHRMQLDLSKKYISKGEVNLFKHMMDNYDIKNKFPGTTLLHIAVKADQPLILEELLRNGAEQKLDNDGLPPSHYLLNGKSGIVNSPAVLKKLNLNQKDKNGVALIHKLAYHGKDNIIISLINNGDIDLNVTTKFGWTPLHFATRQQNLEAVKVLRFKGRANVDIKDKWGRTPMDIAKERRFKKIISVYRIKQFISL